MRLSLCAARLRDAAESPVLGVKCCGSPTQVRRLWDSSKTSESSWSEPAIRSAPRRAFETTPQAGGLLSSSREIGARARAQMSYDGFLLRQVGETGDRAREARAAMNRIADNIFREKVGLWFTIAVVLTIDILLAYRLGTNKGRLFR